MDKNLVEFPLKAWEQENFKSFARVVAIDTTVVMTGLTLASPFSRTMYALLVAPNETGIQSVFLPIVITITLAAVLIALFFVVVSVKNVTAEKLTDENINKASLPKPGTTINLSLLTANDTINANKLGIFKNNKAVNRLYQIAETKEYVVKQYLFRHGLIKRITAAFFAATIFNWLLAFPSTTFLFSDILMQSGVIVAVMILAEALISIFFWQKKQARLKMLASSSAGNQGRIWCQHEMTVTQEISEGGYSKSNLKIEGTALDDLISHNNAKKPEVKTLILKIQELSSKTHSTISLINNSECDIIARVGNEFHEDSIDKLSVINNLYIPACIKQISKSLKTADITTEPEPSVFAGYEGLLDNNRKNNKEDDKKSFRDRHLVAYMGKEEEVEVLSSDPYVELAKDVQNQIDVVLAIQGYYKEIVKNSVMNNFKVVIHGQSNNWITSDPSKYSLKTSVLDKNLNKKVIPELKALMVSADAATRVKLQKKIDEVTDFFEKQVALDKQLESKAALDYDRTVGINTTDGIIPEKDAAEVYIKNLDFYIEELKKGW